MVSVTSSSGATTSLVAALGGGSGIDMMSLAENLARAQFAPRQDRLTARAELLDLQITAASNLKNMIQGLASSLGQRVRQGDLSPQPRIANSAVANAALSGSRQPSGTFSLEVTALARQQTLASQAFASASAPTGSGTLTLRFGAISGGLFTEDTAHAAAAITIAAGATLTDVAAAINGAGAGVSAYVANTVNGAQLVLKGAEGAQNGFILEATEAVGDPGLASLAWTPASATGELLGAAQDAMFKIDGLAMTAPRNTVTDTIPGVTLTLTGTNTGAPTPVTFSDPVTAISAAMTDLTDALNEVAGELASDTNALSGELARDSGARASSCPTPPRARFARLAISGFRPSAMAHSCSTPGGSKRLSGPTGKAPR
jgi:flagellar hook-associated protein 2